MVKVILGSMCSVLWNMGFPNENSSAVAQEMETGKAGDACADKVQASILSSSFTRTTTLPQISHTASTHKQKTQADPSTFTNGALTAIYYHLDLVSPTTQNNIMASAQGTAPSSRRREASPSPPNGRTPWFWNRFRVIKNDTSTSTEPAQLEDIPCDRLVSVSEEEARGGLELLQYTIGRKGYYKGCLEQLEVTLDNTLVEHERVVRELRAENERLRREMVGQEKKLWRMGQFKAIIEEAMAGLAREMVGNDESSAESDEQVGME